MDIPTLTTERLVLRPFRLDDVDAYAAMNADPTVMRYIGEVQDRAAAFRSLCAALGHWHLRGFGPWAIEERATGAFVGRAGLVRFEPWTDVEVAYALVPSAWGKGYAREVVARSLRFAHEVVGARGVVSHILARNAAAIRVAERLGARYAGDADVEGEATAIRIYVYPDPG
ncbi:GNAT family N-acetyltransferase [Anaeromyxobacter oryzae]|uniref:N-acetyltransferase n=1 Tax=Anaeromyxobacter oryzae TaxID=2918170 RepID=A0ABN6MXV7_9BACT|nr:GNAT family N-acetyltransferase [Anaeromyxobacter oryzae]BDG05691.1 N-acetyltransferase [Anaeromyxobacter oryzae]